MFSSVFCLAGFALLTNIMEHHNTRTNRSQAKPRQGKANQAKPAIRTLYDFIWIAGVPSDFVVWRVLNIWCDGWIWRNRKFLFGLCERNDDRAFVLLMLSDMSLNIIAYQFNWAQSLLGGLTWMICYIFFFFDIFIKYTRKSKMAVAAWNNHLGGSFIVTVFFFSNIRSYFSGLGWLNKCRLIYHNYRQKIIR